MRKKIPFLLLFISLISCSKDAPTIINTPALEIDFIKTYGGTKNDVAKSICATADGGYIILGHSQSNDLDVSFKTNTSFDYYVLKFSSSNILEWSKTYGGSKDDRGKSIIQTQDGGYVVLGLSKSDDGDVSSNSGNPDFWVAKLSSNGNLVWEKPFGYSGSDIGISLIETSDKGYLITGELDVSSSGGAGNSRSAKRHAGGDFWAIKLNQTGAKEWSKFYGGSFTDTPEGVVETSDGGYIIVGTSDSNDVDISNNKGTYDIWAIRISSKGTLIWEKNYGGSEIDEAGAIVKTSDGNFIIAGNTRSSDKDVSKNYGGADLWVIKITPDGNVIWEKNFGGSNFDVAHSINNTSDGGFIISGSSRSSDNNITNNGQNDAWIIKINSNGSLLWQKTIGGSEIDFCYDAIELSNGNVVAVGETSSNNQDITINNGFSDLLIIKLK